MSASPPLSPSCPAGGQFFACTTGSLFVGCCESNDACASTGCAAGNLKPASFNSQAAGRYPDQSCPSGSQWYTCADQNPTFLGCCKSDPCSTGCPDDDLAAGILNTVNDIGFVTGSMTGTTSITSSSTRTATTTSASTASQLATTTSAAGSAGFLPVPSATAVTSSTATPQASSSLSGGAIAGIAIGAFVGMLGLLALAMMCCRRHTRLSRQVHTPTVPTNRQSDPETTYYTQNSGLRSPELSYSSQATTLQPLSHSPLVPVAKFQSPRSNHTPHVAELGSEHASPLHPNGAMSPSSLRSDRSYASQVRTPVSRFSFARSQREQLDIHRWDAAELPE